MSLAPELLEAYRAAVYVVYGSPPIEFRIGEPSDVLDALLRIQKASSAAFVSSADVEGVVTPENQRRMKEFLLRGNLAGTPYKVYQGEGRDPAGKWDAEPSLLVMGIPRAEAEALGRRLAQNAIVWIEPGGAPELVVLA